MIIYPLISSGACINNLEFIELSSLNAPESSKVLLTKAYLGLST